MKKKLLLIFVLFASASVIAFETLWIAKTLSIDQVKQRWGAETFDPKKFKDGNEKIRASMAYDLLRKENEFIGKKTSNVREMLGDFTGYYFSDAYATYIVEEGAKIGDDTWQIVFMIDRDRKIKKIVVNKN